MAPSRLSLKISYLALGGFPCQDLLRRQIRLFAPVPPKRVSGRQPAGLGRTQRDAIATFGICRRTGY